MKPTHVETRDKVRRETAAAALELLADAVRHGDLSAMSLVYAPDVGLTVGRLEVGVEPVHGGRPVRESRIANPPKLSRSAVAA